MEETKVQTGVEVQAEIEYQKEDGTWVHSDIEPHGGCKFKDLDKKHRKFLHDVLDEWFDNSNGTGCFYIKDSKFANDFLNKGSLFEYPKSGGETYSAEARQLDEEAAKALQPVLDKFKALGFKTREIEYILSHATLDICLLDLFHNESSEIKKDAVQIETEKEDI